MKGLYRQAFLLFIFFPPFVCANGFATMLAPIWPTPNDAFFRGQPLDSFIQPTASGQVLSGTFGCVRNNGRRFHEGIDIKAIRRNKRNEPIDDIRAVFPGTVAYINRRPGNSAYGCYIVLEHIEEGFRFYTLYAHLASITNGLATGQSVNQGTVLGIMGHTGGGGIPKARAHLHFEIGVSIGTREIFEKWYQAQRYTVRNFHGAWNGFNLVGFDPLDFYRKKLSPLRYVQSLPPAFTLKVGKKGLPSYLEKCRELISVPLPSYHNVLGWEIDFSWFGLPTRWKPLLKDAPKEGSVLLTHVYTTELCIHGSRDTIRTGAKGKYVMGRVLEKIVKLLFNWSKFEFKTAI